MKDQTLVSSIPEQNQNHQNNTITYIILCAQCFHGREKIYVDYKKKKKIGSPLHNMRMRSNKEH